MLFGKKKDKDQPRKPATIEEALSQETAEPVEITEAEVGESMVPQDEEATEEPATAEPEISADQADQDTDDQGTTPVPRDVSELESRKGYLDFGALLLPALKGQKVRLDIDQKTKRVVSLTIAVGQASIQVQAFSAPKSGGIWEDVRSQIEESVLKQKGRVRHLEGRFGTELHARVPTVLKDGRQGWRAARFIGFEGQRWFLRGVIGGRGAIDRKASAGVEALFAHIAVNRGDEPRPPRELLPLRPPKGAKRVVAPKNQQSSANGVPAQAQGARKPSSEGDS